MSENPVRQAIALYDRFTHDGIDRRRFMAELGVIAGGAAAATALLSVIAADPAAAALTASDDPALSIHRVQWRTGPGQAARAGERKAAGAADRVLNGYLAAPAGSPAPLPGVIVIHENRGLNGYIRMLRGGWHWPASSRSRPIS